MWSRVVSCVKIVVRVVGWEGWRLGKRVGNQPAWQTGRVCDTSLPREPLGATHHPSSPAASHAATGPCRNEGVAGRECRQADG